MVRHPVMMRAFLLIICCFVCASCVRQPPEGVIRLHFYLWGEGVIADTERLIIADFERENPDIKIELTTVIGSYNEKMQALIVGGIVPDVMSVDINAYYEWADRGLLLDVTDLLAQAEREEGMTLMPVFREQLPYRGRSYAVPYGLSGVIPQINLDVFEKAGVPVPAVEDFTWEWVAAHAHQLARRAGSTQSPAEIIGSMPDMMSLLLTFGGKIFDDDHNPTKVLINSPETVRMAEFSRRLLATKAMLSRSEVTTSSNWGTEWEMYLQGRTAWFIHGIWQTPTAWHQKHPVRWGALPFPAGPTGLRVTTNGAQLLGASATGKHPEAVKRFLRHYLKPRSIATHTATGSFMPLYRELLGKPGFTDPTWPESVKYYFETMEAGKSMLPVYGPGVGELRRILDTRLSQLATDTSVPIPVQLQRLEEEIYRWLARHKAKGFYP